MNESIKDVELEYQDVHQKYPDFHTGDTIVVHMKIARGKKEKIQKFQGIVIQRRHPNTNGETFTVRKISNGIGVEMIFPILSPLIQQIEIKQKGKVRRARIFYLRNLKGKAAKIKNRLMV